MSHAESSLTQADCTSDSELAAGNVAGYDVCGVAAAAQTCTMSCDEALGDGGGMYHRCNASVRTLSWQAGQRQLSTDVVNR